MNTRERILATSLALFNELGVVRVTTNHIADEMDISPGNLYYHFRKKDDIVLGLYEGFEHGMFELLEAAPVRAPSLEDVWLFLHLVFERIWEHRFLYRDLDFLLRQNQRLRTRFRRVVGRQREAFSALCRGLVEAGSMQARDEDIQALSSNVVLIATYWLSFQRIDAASEQDESQHLGYGVYQVLTLLAPYQSGEARAHLRALARDYLD